MTIGQSTTQMTPNEAGEMILKYFEDHGVTFEYVRVDESGIIELKMSTGFKVVIRPCGFNNQVVLC